MRTLVAATVLLIASPAVAGVGNRASGPNTPAALTLRVSPVSVVLDGAGTEQSLLVTGVDKAGRPRDLTHGAVYRTSNPSVVSVDRTGVLRIVGDGSASVEVRAAGKVARVAVRCRSARAERALSFPNDVLPVLSRAGCNQASCHAKQGGQGGFQLSVLAYDPEADHAAVTRLAGGRRITPTDPTNSLLLRKATLSLAHAGGKRFAVGATEYRLLARWIAEGAPYGKGSDPSLVRVEVEPRERVLQPRESQQLRATAVYSDGGRRDVTRMAEFLSNESGIAEVLEGGRLRSPGAPGEAAVMVRYMGQVAVTRVAVPLNAAVPRSVYARLPRQNFVDELVYGKLSRLNLLPSELCDDATFLRRAYLDLIGTLPTGEETRAFLNECAVETGGNGGNGETQGNGRAGGPSANATSSIPSHSPISSRVRARLVDQLLLRPEYADYWATRWTNLLLVDRDPLFPKGAFAYDRWLRDAFRANVPFDQFARDIVTAAGETYRDGPANFYRALATPAEQSKAISQLFLGVRLECAQCHHHPSERWGQDDFYSMAAFFARVRAKGGTEFERVVYTAPEGEVKHPKTEAVMAPKPLGGALAASAALDDGEDRRETLARWMTAADNPFFARTAVNRVWALLMGTGIVEPVDDFRVTNPPSNEPLLEALAKDFTEHGYDVKHLLRTITNSAAYQRSSRATKNNARDTRHYSRYYPKRMIAEVLLDALGQVSGVPEKFNGHPATTRAIQLWDNKLPVEFLEVFGKPSRLSVCECDRPGDGSITQVLHLMNSAQMQTRLSSDTGTAARLEKSELAREKIVEDLYLAAYNRYPDAAELKAALSAFQRPGATRRGAIEDVLWALLNSPEFLFVH